MDRLGQWLKESGFGDAAGAVMLAMRWKRKAFGGGTGRAGFGSVRLPSGKTSFSPGNSTTSATDIDKIVSNALTDGKAEAEKEAISLPILDDATVAPTETPPITVTPAAEAPPAEATPADAPAAEATALPDIAA